MKTEKLPNKEKEWEGRKITPEEDEALKPIEEERIRKIEEGLEKRQYFPVLKVDKHGNTLGVFVKDSQSKKTVYWLDKQHAKKDIRLTNMKKMAEKMAEFDAMTEEYEGPEQ